MTKDPAPTEVADVIERHRAAGRFFTAAGVGSFVRAEGDGEPVVCMHGLPASSFLYRKVISALAERGFRALSFDLPGLGLAERPRDFDPSFLGLGAFAAAAVDALDLDRFHLVVHDAGGPVGFELVSRMPQRIRSLTVLNTALEVAATPFPGELLARSVPRVPSWLATPRIWRRLMLLGGVSDATALTPAEIDAYRVLALGDDGAAGYLRIMAALRRHREGPRNAALVDARRTAYPVALAWGGDDPLLRVGRQGMALLRATGLPEMAVLPGKHYLQEEQAPAIAAVIARNAASQERVEGSAA